MDGFKEKSRKTMVFIISCFFLNQLVVEFLVEPIPGVGRFLFPKKNLADIPRWCSVEMMIVKPGKFGDLRKTHKTDRIPGKRQRRWFRSPFCLLRATSFTSFQPLDLWWTNQWLLLKTHGLWLMFPWSLLINSLWIPQSLCQITCLAPHILLTEVSSPEQFYLPSGNLLHSYWKWP